MAAVETPCLLLLAALRSQQFHLDEAAGVEFELARPGRVAGCDADGRELEHDRLVALDEPVDEELIEARLELEMLEGVDVHADREWREVTRRGRTVDDDPLDPARPARDKIPAA